MKLAIIFIAGLELTSGLGELNPGYLGLIRINDTQLSYSSQDKYTRGGYTIDFNQDFRFKYVFFTARFTYRNGKDWSKYGPWIGLGVGKSAQLRYEKAFNSYNKEQRLEFRYSYSPKKYLIEYQVFLENFDGSSYGYGSTVLVGIKF